MADDVMTAINAEEDQQDSITRGKRDADKAGQATVAAMQKSDEEARKILAEEQSALSPLVKGVGETIAQPRPKMGQLTPQPAPPETPDKKGEQMSNWFNAALLLSAVAGAFSRNSATVAMNAFAGAIEGFKSGQQQKFETDFKAWQAASKKTLEDNRLVTDQYERALADRKTSLDEKMLQIQVISAQYKDRIMFEASASKNYTMVAQLLEKQREFERRMEEAANNIDRRHDARMEEIAEQAKNKLNSPGGIEWYMGLPEDQRTRVDKFLQMGGGGRGMKLNDEQLDTIADNMASGKLPPNFKGIYGYNRGAIEAKLSQKHPEFSVTQASLEYERAEKEIGALNNTRMVQFTGFARALNNTIERTKQLASELELSGIAPLNRARLEWLTQYRGNTKEGQLARQYLANVNAVKSEMANVENGGYAPTESVWQLANQQVGADFGVKNLTAALGEVQRVITYRLQAIPGLQQIGPGAPNRYLPGVENPPQPGAPGGGAAAPAPTPGGASTGPDWSKATVEVH